LQECMVEGTVFWSWLHLSTAAVQADDTLDMELTASATVQHKEKRFKRIIPQKFDWWGFRSCWPNKIISPTMHCKEV
jgi:hypothetical protein